MAAPAQHVDILPPRGMRSPTDLHPGDADLGDPYQLDVGGCGCGTCREQVRIKAPLLRGPEWRRSRTRWPTRLPRSSTASILRAWPPPGRRPPRPVACPGTASLRLPARRSGRCPRLGRRLADIEPSLVSWVVNSPVVPAAKIRSTSCAARSLYTAFVGMPPL